MSVEEDIGGLKADMTTIKDQTSRIFTKIDHMSSNLTAHSSRTIVRLDVLEEKQAGLNEHIDTRVDPHIRSLIRVRSGAVGVFVGIGSVAGFASSALFDAVKVFLKGDS